MSNVTSLGASLALWHAWIWFPVGSKANLLFCRPREEEMMVKIWIWVVSAVQSLRLLRGQLIAIARNWGWKVLVVLVWNTEIGQRRCSMNLMFRWLAHWVSFWLWPRHGPGRCHPVYRLRNLSRKPKEEFLRKKMNVGGCAHAPEVWTADPSEMVMLQDIQCNAPRKWILTRTWKALASF